MEKKYDALSRNFLLFTIGSFGQKMLTFLLVPLYTSLLTTEQYGLIDLISTSTTLLIPVFTANIAEAVMRFTLQDQDNREFLSIGAAVMARGTGVLAVILLLLSAVPGIPGSYLVWTFLLYLAGSGNGLYQNYVRAVGQIRMYVLSSLMQTAVMLLSNVVFLVWLNRGVDGYFLSQVLGTLAGIAFLEGNLGVARKIHWKVCVKGETARVLLRYSIPTIFTALAWWINSSLDHYFVTALCGIAANGIYAVAYKIPNILGVFQGIFQQAWTLSAITEFDGQDSDGFFGKTYTYYQCTMLLICCAMILGNRVLCRILYAKEFFEAWRYVPVLLAASFFSALSGYLGSIFAAAKDTKTCAYSTVASALVNVVLNTLWIPRYGILGAACATLAAYFASWGIRVVVSRKYIRMKCSFAKDAGAYCLLLIQVAAALKGNYVVQILAAAGLAALYVREYRQAARQLLAWLAQKRKGRHT